MIDFTPLKEFMDSLTDWIIPGNSINVYYKNEPVFCYSSGYSDIEKKDPMRDDMFLNIYSCSKVATVVSALTLVEKGLISLDTPLYDIIPEYRYMNVLQENGDFKKAEKIITIENLFTMTAGLTYRFDSCGIKKAQSLTNGKMDTVTVARCIADDPLIFEPGTMWNYSFCHDVLAAVCEIVSGKRFSLFVRENVFLPCGIENAEFHHNEAVLFNMATQYKYEISENIDAVSAQRGESAGKHGELTKVSYKNLSFTLGPLYDSGGAGIITTVKDFAKLANALANFGVAKTGERILKKETVESLRTNRLSKSQLKGFNWPQLSGYGYGLGVRTLIDKEKSNSNGPIGEFGWGGAAGATVLVDAENELSFFYAHHMLNPQEEYYQPRLRNALYSCFK